jgi:hypothetical protein
MSGNCELGRGLLRREKNATEGGAGRFEKPAPDARAAPPEAHESLIGRKTVEEVPLTGLSSISVTVTNVTPLKRENDGSYTTSFTVELYYR